MCTRNTWWGNELQFKYIQKEEWITFKTIKTQQERERERERVYICMALSMSEWNGKEKNYTTNPEKKVQRKIK